MNPASFFSPDYRTARAKFQAAAKAAGCEVATYAHPLKGPEGEDLATDVVRIGPADAKRYIVLNTATHGVEGFCGSGAVIGVLTERLDRELPPNTAFLIIHAINPYGFAWLRRVNEDNVDLNRNFLDFSQPLPVNAEYANIHQWLVPRNFEGEELARADAELGKARERLGAKPFQGAVSGGQYAFPDGLFYGGSGPTWSNRTLRRILPEMIGDATHVLFFDFHTGLGPYGYAEPINGHPPGTDGYQRLFDWIGDCVTSAQTGTSSSTRLSGTIGFGVMEALPNAIHTKSTLEYGTRPNEYVRLALRSDCWLHNYGDLKSPRAKEIKALIRDAFYRDYDDWKELVYVRARQIIRRGIAGLSTQKD
ncbi:M14 family metallopeptidase [Stella sp.]|uniref:M14 family metallopeptidase n=1 Tax=Stella sp. TaxID=2912054 RepID=UPI0035AE4EEA